MGPPPRSFAADAHACIMVRAFAAHRIQGCGAIVRAISELPSDRHPGPHRVCRRARSCQGHACGGRQKRRPALTAPVRDAVGMSGSGRRNGLPSRTKKLTMKKKMAGSFCLTAHQQADGTNMAIVLLAPHGRCRMELYLSKLLTSRIGRSRTGEIS